MAAVKRHYMPPSGSTLRPTTQDLLLPSPPPSKKPALNMIKR